MNIETDAEVDVGAEAAFLDPLIEPLTKAKLFTATADDGSWTEMGIGVVSVSVTHAMSSDGGEGTAQALEESLPSATGGSGKRGKATEPTAPHTRRSAKLEMVALEDASDVLLSTPLTLEDIYLVQHETILVWSDPQLGRDMACSFNTKEGCDKIMGEIHSFQRTERAALAGSLQNERMDSVSSSDRWSVAATHLPAILDAALTNTQRFGIYVRDHDSYFRQLSVLFETSKANGDAKSMELIGSITLALLRSPYNTEGRIIAQFVENSIIDKCIDIVQYALGRRDAASGFISFEERRATFRNPCQFNEALQSRIHVLYSCGFLKDLLPLSLEDGDTLSTSLLSTFLLRFKYTLMEEVCRSDTILPDAFHRAETDGITSELYELAAFATDMTRTVKTAVMPLDAKEDLFALLIHTGVLAFLTVVLRRALADYGSSQLKDAPASPSAGTTDSQSRQPIAAGKAIQMACDTICNCIAMLPASREQLVEEATTTPKQCTLTLLMQAMTVVRTSAELQAVLDAVLSCGVGVLLTQAFLTSTVALTKKRDILNFWVNGSGMEKPALFHVAANVAGVLRRRSQRSNSSTSVLHATSAGEDRAEELQVVYALRMLEALIDEMDDTQCGSLAELLSLSKLVPAMASIIRLSGRRHANVQSSVVALLASFISNGDTRLFRLLCESPSDEKSSGAAESLLRTCMLRYLECCVRDNILTSSTGHFFSLLCEGVHREKANSAGGGGGGPAFGAAASPYVSILHNEDSTTKVEASLGASAVYQESVSELLQSYGEQLKLRAPILAERMQSALQETPEEAQMAEVETSSIASTLERPNSGLSEFDAMAIEFGIDVSTSRSPSTSPTTEPASFDNPHLALLELEGDDLSTSSSGSGSDDGEHDQESANEEAGKQLRGRHRPLVLLADEEAERSSSSSAVLTAAKVVEGSPAENGTTGGVGEKHARPEPAASEEEGNGKTLTEMAAKRQKSEDSAVPSAAAQS